MAAAPWPCRFECKRLRLAGCSCAVSDCAAFERNSMRSSWPMLELRLPVQTWPSRVIGTRAQFNFGNVMVFCLGAGRRQHSEACSSHGGLRRRLELLWLSMCVRPRHLPAAFCTCLVMSFRALGRTRRQRPYSHFPSTLRCVEPRHAAIQSSLAPCVEKKRSRARCQLRKGTSTWSSVGAIFSARAVLGNRNSPG